PALLADGRWGHHIATIGLTVYTLNGLELTRTDIVHALGIAIEEVVATAAGLCHPPGRRLVVQVNGVPAIANVDIEDHQPRRLAGNETDVGVRPLLPPTADFLLGGRAGLVLGPGDERFLAAGSDRDDV